MFHESLKKLVDEILFAPSPLSSLGFPCGSAGKESACNGEDLGLTPGLGRSPGEGKGYPLQYSGLENSMDSIRPWSHKELEMTERLSFTYICIEIWTYDLKHLDKNT